MLQLLSLNTNGTKQYKPLLHRLKLNTHGVGGGGWGTDEG